MNSKQKFIFIIVLVLIFSIGLFYFGKKIFVNKNYQNNNQGNNQEVDINKEFGVKNFELNSPFGQIPFSFNPAKINAIPINNYSHDLGDKEQFTYRFLSNKSLDENFNIYKNLILNDNWQIINTVNEDNYKAFFAKKNNYYLNITMNFKEEVEIEGKIISNRKVIVDITIIGPKSFKTIQ